MVQIIQGLNEVIENYDGFIVDVWGVIYNGENLYPAALTCLESLKRKGKKIVFLTNSSQLKKNLTDKLSALGLDKGLYHDIVTAGDHVKTLLLDKKYSGPFYHIGSEHHSNLFHRPVSQNSSELNSPTLEEANFILLTSIPEDYYRNQDYFSEILKEGAARKLPMICSNPDLISMIAGQITICPGSLAEQYQKLGGDVVYCGKPYPEVYETTRQKLAEIPSSRIACIGDTLYTDMQGAKNAQLDGIWIVEEGVHSLEIAGANAKTNMQDLVTKVTNKYKIYPKYAMPYFQY